jgi:hypothetical protein
VQRHGTHCSFLLRQVSLLALRSPSGPLGPVDAQLRTLLKEDAGKITPEAAAAIVRSVIQALRLYACVFRSSVRRCVARLGNNLNSAAMPCVESLCWSRLSWAIVNPLAPVGWSSICKQSSSSAEVTLQMGLPVSAGV